MSESILPELDQNFVFPNTSPRLTELGSGSQFRENPGARHAGVSSGHSCALVAGTLLCGLLPLFSPKAPNQTHEVSPRPGEVESKQAGSRGEQKRRWPGR